MFKKIEEILKSTRPQDLSSEESSMMWSKIERGIAVQKAHSVLPVATILKRFVLTPLLALSLLGGSTVAFADNARPGDFLFPLDELAEQVHIALSSTDRRAELRIEFAEERFEEAREILAEYATNTGIEIATLSSDSSGDTTSATSTSETTATSTPETSAATTTPSTDSSNSDGSSNDNEGTNESTENDATINSLSQALSYLEETRAKLLAEGNDHAVPAIDRIIADLTELMENELGSFHSARVFAKTDGDDVKISVRTRTDDGNASFTFKKDDDEEKIRIRVNEDGVKTSLRIDEDEGFFSFNFKNKNKNRGDDHDEDEDDDEYREKYRNGKVTICHQAGGLFYKHGRTITVSDRSLEAHLAHGDTKGRCGDKDDDDHDEDEDDHDDDEDNDKDNTDTTAPIIADLSHSAGTTTAQVSWSTDENADGMLWIATTSPVDISSSPDASESSFSQDHAFDLSGLTASTTYYYIVSSTDDSGNTATSSEGSFTTLSDEVPEPEDTTPPVLSNITAENIGTTTADVSWDTDEPADSTVWYGTGTPLDLTSALNESSGATTTSHSLSLTGLTASTTYYYLVVSTDEAGNTATSTEQTFETLAPEPEDTLPPVIANISVTNLASTTATINWDTNEDADGKLWYGDTSPIALDTDPQELSTTLETGHLFDLTGLTASTTYYYVLSSTDAANNTSTSTEQTFTTL